MGRHYEKEQKKQGNKNVMLNLLFVVSLPVLIVTLGIFNGIIGWFIFGIILFIVMMVKQNSPNKKIEEAWDKDFQEEREKEDRAKEQQEKQDNHFKKKIIALLEKKGTKMPASDIAGFLGEEWTDTEYIKEMCEELYFAEKILRTGNYRYYI